LESLAGSLARGGLGGTRAPARGLYGRDQPSSATTMKASDSGVRDGDWWTATTTTSSC